MKKKLTTPVLLIEGGADDANLRYISGFTAPDPVVLLVCGRRSSLVVSLLEVSRAKQQARVHEVWTPQELELPAKRRYHVAEWAVALLKKKNIREIQVGARFPVGVADRLRRARIKVKVAAGALFPERRHKSDAEINHIRQSQRAAVHAMKAAIALIRSSAPDKRQVLRVQRNVLTAEHVRHAIDTTLLNYDVMAEDTIVACGAQAVDPHERGHGPLRAGVPIVLDIFPRHKKHGYWGDITRTVVKGTPSADVQRMYRAVLAAQKSALAAVRAGVAVRTVHQAAQKMLVSHGFETTVKNGWGEGFIHSTGHGVGLNIHEAPSLNLSDTRLIAGDVITVEPGLYYKHLGGIRIEDTVVVTRDGYRMLASCSKSFNI